MVAVAVAFAFACLFVVEMCICVTYPRCRRHVILSSVHIFNLITLTVGLG